jgi:hypothetical protein
MKRGGFFGWPILVLGLLWLVLVGSCTVSMSRNDEYGFWVIGAAVTALGVFPFFVGLSRVSGPRIAGWALIATGLVAGVGLLVLFLPSQTGAHRIDFSEFIWTLLLFIIGPPSLLVLWGVMLLNRARRETRI